MPNTPNQQMDAGNAGQISRGATSGTDNASQANSMGTTSSTGFQFEDIAYAKFLQTAPELANMVVVFKDCSEELNEESDVQVGIFVLRSGDDILYVPVVSKGDGVYPIDSIFINSKNKFFPLTKNTTERILNSQKLSMGSPKKIPDTVPTNPSVYHLVNPPRTGKFVYASSSRLVEFLASMPASLKTQVMEKFAADSEVYNSLNKLFDIKAIFAALKASNLDPATQPKDRSIGVRVITGGDNLPNPQIASILTDGYTLDGNNPISRIAVTSEWWLDKRFSGLSDLEAGYDYEVVMSTGRFRRAFVPMQRNLISTYWPDTGTLETKRSTGNDKAAPQFMLFDNGDYAIKQNAVIVGERKEGNNVLRHLLNLRPPTVLKNVNNGDTIAIFDENFALIGVYEVRSIVQTFDGCTVKAWDCLNNGSTVVQGVRGYTIRAAGTDKEMFVSMSSPVIVLATRTTDLEDTVNAAARRREFLEWAMFNSSMNLTHDGVEFSINGSPIGKQAEVMQVLVEKEGIDPVVAQKFIKQATEQKKVVIYLSKQAADFEPGEIPQFGSQPPRQINTLGKGNDYLPDYNLKAGIATGDPQTVESVVLSELLQAPDLKECVTEYLPDIEDGIDKLGRILFLARLHMNRLGEGFEANQVFELLSSLKNVYANLGNNYIKLENLANTMSDVAPKK